MVTSEKLISPAYRQAAHRRQLLGEEKLALISEDARLRDKGEWSAQGRRAEIGQRLHEIEQELTDGRGAFDTLKRRSRAEAGQQLAADTDYRKLIIAAITAEAASLEAWLRLGAVVVEARRRGVEAQPLPPSIVTQIDELVKWTAAAIRRGALDADMVPPALRALVEKEEN